MNTSNPSRERASDSSDWVALRDSPIVMRVASRGMRTMPPDQRPAP